MPATSPSSVTTESEPMVEGRPVTLAEVKALLERERERRTEEELTYEQKLSLDHATLFARLSLEQARELADKLRGTSPKMNETHVVKIVDLAPLHPDDVRAIFAKDRIQLDQGEIDKIIELVRGYLG